MAEYAALPSHIKLTMHGEGVNWRGFGPRKAYIPVQRKWSSGSAKFTQLLQCNVLELSAPLVANLKVNPFLKERFTKCYCLGTLLNSDGVIASEWISVVDQVLLIASVFLTYMAGVIPAEKPFLNPQKKNIVDDHVISEDSTFYGSTAANDEDFGLKFAWDIVEEKLLDSLNVMQMNNLENKGVEFEPDSAKQPLSLSAIAEGPRLQLLWASFQWLKNEVGGISESAAVVCTADWLTIFFEIVQKSSKPICMAWLEKELCLKNSKTNKALLSSVVEKLEGNDTTLQSIRKSGRGAVTIIACLLPMELPY